MPRFIPAKKILAFFILTTFLLTLIPVFSKAVGSSQFSTGYDISFNFSDNGQAQVTHSITLTNLTKDYFASEYSITTGSDKVSNISGNDGLGGLNVTTKTQDSSTILIAKLNQQVVGQGKSVSFKINYTIDSLAVKRGKVWEVNLPQIVTNENLSSYKLSLGVPKSFGPVGKMAPVADQTSDSGSAIIYIFNKSSGSSGVVANFGEFQLFKFTLKYRYKNKNLFPVSGKIALPPDTEYQALYYQSLDPRPTSMSVDESGNYIAEFNIKGSSNLEVIAQGWVKVFDSETTFQRPKAWSESELKLFTKSDKYIDSENPQIQKKAKELKDIQEIYNYVTTTLKYDYSRLQADSIGRRGSLTAFNQPEKSICTDFSDLFVALARAKGIPARGLVGFAYTDNTNLRPTKIEGLVDTTVLHAWPEFYDRQKNRWIQVDPTWGSTTGGVDYFNKLDTNHIVFAVNGVSSEEPLPAGAYKTASNQVDDVKVEFSNDEIKFGATPKLSFSKQKVVSGFPATGSVLIENMTGRAVFNSKIQIFSKEPSLGLIDPKERDLGIILPFEKRTFNLKLRSDSLLDNKEAQLGLLFRGTDAQKDLEVNNQQKILIKPFFSLEIQQIALGVVLLIVAISFLYPYFYRWRNR